MFCLTAKLLQVKVYKRRSKYVNWPNFPPGEKDINEISKPKNYFITKNIAHAALVFLTVAQFFLQSNFEKQYFSDAEMPPVEDHNEEISDFSLEVTAY